MKLQLKKSELKKIDGNWFCNSDGGIYKNIDFTASTYEQFTKCDSNQVNKFSLAAKNAGLTIRQLNKYVKLMSKF